LGCVSSVPKRAQKISSVYKEVDKGSGEHHRIKESPKI
jgi:hypothetical protein